MWKICTPEIIKYFLEELKNIWINGETFHVYRMEDPTLFICQFSPNWSDLIHSLSKSQQGFCKNWQAN